ncbi:MAG: NAD(P)-binding domain-containing protein [Gluconacetobacter diazotrophicus]|nr:NAD(P)-binding domain-containing protein [Gluconacetobacter diazotrophicus]
MRTMARIALIGAGGKMGGRITDNLLRTEHEVRHVEVSERGIEALRGKGVEVHEVERALADADAVILAVPDNRIGQVAAGLDNSLKAGQMLIVLDAAAPYAGDMPKRDDITIFVTHPCHPPIFNDEVEPEARGDYFGGIAAKQHIVCALMQGPEEHYALGEQIARELWAPVMRSHRVTVEQMAVLEPVLSETVTATCLTVIREAVDEAVKRGVPEQAAMDFVLGHMNVEIAIIFGQLANGTLSDGAKLAVEKAKTSLFRPDWKQVFEPDAIRQSVFDITRH